MNDRRLLALAVFCVGLPAAVFAHRTHVVTIESSAIADLVVCDAGFEDGVRSGMVARVLREEVEVAEVVFVEVRPSASACLILSLTSGDSIRPGDVVVAKTFKS